MITVVVVVIMIVVVVVVTVVGVVVIIVIMIVVVVIVIMIVVVVIVIMIVVLMIISLPHLVTFAGNADGPMVLITDGSQWIHLKLQPINAFVEIILTELGIDTSVRLLHPPNDPIDIFVILLGISMEYNAKHDWKV